MSDQTHTLTIGAGKDRRRAERVLAILILMRRLLDKAIALLSRGTP
jgi:hypothetical protein